MTETQQKCFLAVAEHLSFSKAAEILYVSQPAISKSILALEAEVGAVLFFRQGKYVSLTKAGEILREFLTEYARSYQDAMDRLRNLEQDIYSGSVVIGCDSTWNAANFLPRMEQHFSENYPGMELDILGLDPENFISALRSKEADVVIMYAGDCKKIPDIVTLPFATIRCGFLVSAQLCPGPESGGLSDLEKKPILVVDSATERGGKLIYNTMFMDLYKKLSPNPELKFCRNLSSAALCVSGGKGIMFADSWTGAVSNTHFRFYPIDDSLELCIAYLASNSGSHIQLFAEQASKLFTENPKAH